MRTALFVLVAMLLAVALVAAEPALAGVIEGSVALTPADLAIHDNSRPNPYVGQLSASASASASVAAAAAAVDTVYGIAWVADLPPEAGVARPPARMDQLGQRFVPRVLVIVAGQEVEFHNSDNVFHNIFSYSPPKKFDLGRYPKGRSRSVTFVKPGAVQVYCDIHSDMRGDIIVAPTRRFARIGPGGSFRIEDVPPGDHTVEVWLSSGTRSTAVQVPERGTATLSTLMP